MGVSARVRKIKPVKIVKIDHLRKLSPAKISRYTVYVHDQYMYT